MMSRDKQISEMAKALGIAFQLAGTTRFGEVAEVLVNAGYRKSTDIAEEIFAEIKHIGGCSDGVRLNWWDIAELEKKYTEDGK